MKHKCGIVNDRGRDIFVSFLEMTQFKAEAQGKEIRIQFEFLINVLRLESSCLLGSLE